MNALSDASLVVDIKRYASEAPNTVKMPAKGNILVNYEPGRQSRDDGQRPDLRGAPN